MIRKGLWSPEEDEKLRRCISKYVNGSWNDIAKKAGLERCGRSCRQRWLNHLRPGLRKEKFSREEVKQVMELQSKLGNRWSEIAGQMKGRTDNEVKNLWNTVIKRRLMFSAGGYSSKTYKADHHEDNHDLVVDSSQLDPHADSPSHTASSQSASSSHSSTCVATSWNLHINPSPVDVDFCSTLTSHVGDPHLTFLDELYLSPPQQLLMINSPGLMQANINGGDQPRAGPHATSDVVGSSIPMQSSYGLVKEDFMDDSTNFSCQSLVPTFDLTLPSVAHDQQTLLIPPLPPSLSTQSFEHWDSSAKLVDVDATFPYTLSTQSFENASIIQDSKTPSTLISCTPNTYAFQNNSILEGDTLPSTTLESISTIEGGHYLTSIILPQQYLSVTLGDSHALPPSPQLINFIVHEDKDYMLNLGTCDHTHHDFNTACFDHRHEYSTPTNVNITNLMWSGGCQ